MFLVIEMVPFPYEKKDFPCLQQTAHGQRPQALRPIRENDNKKAP